jgi:hypothetical protein
MVRNELARLVGPEAEYRADQEAGVTGRRPRDLLVATGRSAGWRARRRKHAPPLTAQLETPGDAARSVAAAAKRG